MPRLARVAVGGMPYHVINRSNGRVAIFRDKKEYQHFESLLQEGVEFIGMRILAYCIMPNHWHLVLYPEHDGDLSEFMRWVTTTHVRQRRTQTNSVGDGHLYQGTYKSFPIETDRHLQTVIRYVEQNPLRAKLTTRAEDWQWSSLWRREQGVESQKKLLAPLPTQLPDNYLESVNSLLRGDDLDRLRYSVTKGAPYGTQDWTDEIVHKYRLGSTLRGPGRPRSV